MVFKLRVGALARAALALAALASCDAGLGRQEPTARLAEPRASRSRTSHVTVALVIDQLPLWQVLERFPTLPKGGGLSRLMHEADIAAELRYGYVQTSTAMGHSALFTGQPPHASHITANEVLTAEGKPIAIVSDPATRVVGGAGTVDRPGASLAALNPEQETIGDALRRQRPDVTIVCMSMKDRGAVFACGRKPDAVLWFDTHEDAFVTSTAYATSFPALASAFGVSGVGARYREKPWQPLDQSWLTARGASSGDVGQGDFEGLGNHFPHDFTGLAKPARAMLATPMADELLTDLAISVVEGLPPERDAYVAISFSAHDYVNHVFGPGAPESWDELVRLDRQIGRLYKRLDELYGAAGYAIVLASDHGGPPAPEGPAAAYCESQGRDRFERPCGPAQRILGAELTKTAARAAQSTLGAGHWILGTSEPFVVFTDAAKALPKEDLDRLVAAEIEALTSVAGVERIVDTRTTEQGDCPDYADDSLPALLCRSLAGSKREDLLILPKLGAFFDSGYVEGDGCNHGTPYLFDRTVPFLVRRPRSERASDQRHGLPRFEASKRVDVRAYSQALAELLAIEPPTLALEPERDRRQAETAPPNVTRR